MHMANGMEAARIFLLYGLPVLMVGGAIALSALLLRRMKQLHAQVVRGEEELRAATASWARSFAAMGKEMETIAEEKKHPSTDLSASAATRRKVLKMHRLGSSVEQIARALRLSKGEVMLLLKVHTIILRPLEQTADGRDIVSLEQNS